MNGLPMSTPFKVLKVKFYTHEVYGGTILLTCLDMENEETFCVFLPKRYISELSEEDFKDFNPDQTPLYFMITKRAAKTSFLKFANSPSEFKLKPAQDKAVLV